MCELGGKFKFPPRILTELFYVQEETEREREEAASKKTL